MRVRRRTFQQVVVVKELPAHYKFQVCGRVGLLAPQRPFCALVNGPAHQRAPSSQRTQTAGRRSKAAQAHDGAGKRKRALTCASPAPWGQRRRSCSLTPSTVRVLATGNGPISPCVSRQRSSTFIEPGCPGRGAAGPGRPAALAACACSLPSCRQAPGLFRDAPLLKPLRRSQSCTLWGGSAEQMTLCFCSPTSCALQSRLSCGKKKRRQRQGRQQPFPNSTDCNIAGVPAAPATALRLRLICLRSCTHGRQRDCGGQAGARRLRPYGGMLCSGSVLLYALRICNACCTRRCPPGELIQRAGRGRACPLASRGAAPAWRRACERAGRPAARCGAAESQRAGCRCRRASAATDTSGVHQGGARRRGRAQHAASPGADGGLGRLGRLGRRRGVGRPPGPRAARPPAERR